MSNDQKEDLREFYITPVYLTTMEKRSKNWSDQFISEQITLFKHSIAEYPEVIELLEGELYRRELEAFRKKIKLHNTEELKRLKTTVDAESDFAELIHVEMDFRKRLKSL